MVARPNVTSWSTVIGGLMYRSLSTNAAFWNLVQPCVVLRHFISLCRTFSPHPRCGSVMEGYLVFEKIIGKDKYSWNSMIAGYGMHGLGQKALRTFNRMIESGYEPYGVTFVACISSCNHAALVNKGRYFTT
ncbi:hypothetical protein POM88_027203 [Heracleum sosnowskyi]|uniref:Pentatricopeptide repeat-containing protein n=1 Tax=Heracleum sosnowskyi TaxID=360622 RepID=A0AAD8I8J0_9APIA|nr:hypothetical protein POM88_027203 [Heracleum sosnowskyi]